MKAESNWSSEEDMLKGRLIVLRGMLFGIQYGMADGLNNHIETQIIDEIIAVRERLKEIKK